MARSKIGRERGREKDGEKEKERVRESEDGGIGQHAARLSQFLS